MRTKTLLVPFLLLALLLASCAPSPASPGEAAPFPQPTRPADPAGADLTPAPTTTTAPLPRPTEALPGEVIGAIPTDPGSEAVEGVTLDPATMADLSRYTLYPEVVLSPDGQWEAEFLRGEIATPANSDMELDYNRLTVTHAADRARRWLWQDYSKHGLGEAWPAFFIFSADGAALYFYDQITADGGCGLTFQANLRRMDLATGEVAAVPGFTAEGHFSVSPGARWAGRMVDSSLELTSLAGGDARVIPFEKPTGDETGFPTLLWSPDGRYAAFNLYANPGQCEARSIFLETVLVDSEAGTARLLGVEDNIAGAMRWDDAGGLLLQTGRDVLARFDPATGQVSESPVDQDAILAEQARWGLTRWLRDLALAGRQPGLYEELAARFDGWEALSGRYPTLRFDSPASMLRYACESDVFACYTPRQVRLDEVAPGKIYHLRAQFLTPRGEVLAVNGQTWFPFRVDMSRFPEHTPVLDLPPAVEK